MDITLAAMSAAFGAGLVSVLSPCVMPLMPAYLSLVSGFTVEELRAGSGNPRDLRRRVLLGCAAFVAGFSTVFVLLGAGASVVGQFLRSTRFELFGLLISPLQIAGLVIVLMGLHIIGWLPIRLLYRDTRFQGAGAPGGQVGRLGIYLTGAAFAFGWSPCVGPILSGILTIAGSHETVYQGMGLLAIYSAGLGLPFFLAGWSMERLLSTQRRLGPYMRTIEVGSGVLLIALGVLVMSDRLTELNGYFSFLGDFALQLEEWLL